jgi:hypothetical protein
VLKLRLKPITFMKVLLAASVVLPFAVPTALRAQVDSTFSSRAQGLNGPLPTIKVWSGSGVNLSFIPTGETIVKVWLDDPSKVTLDFDSPLCGSGSGQGNCKGGSGATVVHLRQIYGIKFPNLPQTKATLLSVITQDSGGQRKLNQFRVVMASGAPKYAAFLVYPDTKKAPTLQVRDRIVPLTIVEGGLRKAESQRLLTPALRGKVLNFLALAQNGVPVTVAAQQAGVSMALVTKLADMGQQNQFPDALSPSNAARNVGRWR